MTLTAYKTRLKLNNKERTKLEQFAGAARWAWNWGLAEKRAARERGEKPPSAYDLDKRITILKRTPEFAWLCGVPRHATKQALLNLDDAYRRVFRAREKGMDWGFPKRKKKYGARSRASFTLFDGIKVFERAIQLPNIGRLRLYERGYIPTDVKAKSATISRDGDKWFVSVLMDVAPEAPALNPHPLGVDLGFITLATISNGKTVELPPEIMAGRKRVEALSRALSRKKFRSAGWRKAKRELQRAHADLRNLRSITLHRLTKRLAQNAVVGIETLNVKGMMKNRRMARKAGDVGMYEFRRQIEYKAERNGGLVVKANTFYPSTKACSRCGHVQDVALSERVYRCAECGLQIGRDLNAARNLRNLAANTAAGGEDVRPLRKPRRFSLKPRAGIAVSPAVSEDTALSGELEQPHSPGGQ